MAWTCTLNEGRDRNPGDTSRIPSRELPRGSLNEGRDRNPGDTATETGPASRLCVAQRRPGP